MTVSPAVARDNGSVWLVSPRTVRIGSVLIVPPEVAAPLNALRLTDSTAFGTGHHPTTALCVEALEEAFTIAVPDSILDVGTGSGVLALTALMIGVSRAVGLDIDAGGRWISNAKDVVNKTRKPVVTIRIVSKPTT
jgi:ribosomal protein L11 methyltransferase